MPEITKGQKALIDEGSALKARMKADAARLKEIEAGLATLSAGKYEGNNPGAAVSRIAPEASIKLEADAVEPVREILGEDFGKLFDRKVSYSPTKSFREVLAALADGKRVEKRILALVEKPAEPYFKWS